VPFVISRRGDLGNELRAIHVSPSRDRLGGPMYGVVQADEVSHEGGKMFSPSGALLKRARLAWVVT